MFTATRVGGPVTFRGEFRGNLRDLTFELFYRRVIPWGDARVSLSIDGRSVLSGAAVYPTSSKIWERYLISVPSLGCSGDIAGGFASEQGFGSAAHTISLTVDVLSFEPSGAWLWGASEFPAGITFNPDGRLTGAKLKPLDPPNCTPNAEVRR